MAMLDHSSSVFSALFVALITMMASTDKNGRNVGIFRQVQAFCHGLHMDWRFVSVQEISNGRTHWTDPEKTWVSNISGNLFRGPLVRSYSIFDRIWFLEDIHACCPLLQNIARFCANAKKNGANLNWRSRTMVLSWKWRSGFPRSTPFCCTDFVGPFFLQREKPTPKWIV